VLQSSITITGAETSSLQCKELILSVGLEPGWIARPASELLGIPA
jgi:hypothetical protein